MRPPLLAGFDTGINKSSQVTANLSASFCGCVIFQARVVQSATETCLIAYEYLPIILQILFATARNRHYAGSQTTHRQCDGRGV